MDRGADELSQDQNRVVAQRVREELARRRMSRQQLADAGRISLSTLEKALAGSRSFTLATTLRLEEALGLRLRSVRAADDATPGGTAPGALGSYSREGGAWLEGAYLTLRPSYGEPGSLYAYLTEIVWDKASSRLMFREAQRLDSEFTQSGVVSMPNKSGQIYLHTNEQGQMRLALLGRPAINGALYGLLATLQVGAGTQLIPVASPYVLVPTTRLRDELAFGRIAPSHPRFESYQAHLARVTRDGFARLLPGGPA